MACSELKLQLCLTLQLLTALNMQLNGALIDIY